MSITKLVLGNSGWMENVTSLLLLVFKKVTRSPWDNLLLTLALFSYVMRCAIWCHLYNLKKVKNTHGGVLLLFTKGSTPPWVIYTVFNLYKGYQIAQNIPYKFIIFEAVELFEGCDTSVTASCIMLISSLTTLICYC